MGKDWVDGDEIICYTKKMINPNWQNKELIDLVRDRNIAIVGPSPHLINKSFGNIIDSCDVVCRTNDIFPKGRDVDYGGRTDILFYTCSPESLDGFDEKRITHKQIIDKLKMVVCPCSDIQSKGKFEVVNVFKKINRDNKLNSCFIKDDYWVSIKDACDCEPNSGVTSIIMLLDCPIKSLSIFGFSFYGDGDKYGDFYYPEYYSREFKEKYYPGCDVFMQLGHKQDRQKKFLSELFSKNKGRIFLDSEASRQLNLDAGEFKLKIMDVDKKKSENFTLLFCNKNNYILLDKVFFEKSGSKFSNMRKVNIDVNSERGKLEEGKSILKKHNVEFINDGTKNYNFIPMESCVDYAIKYLKKQNRLLDWIIVSQTDVWPVGGDFEHEFDKFLKSYEYLIDKIGMIGFCAQGGEWYGRGHLVQELDNTRGSIYKELPKEYEKVDYFCVESPAWAFVAINTKLWQKHIKVDNDLILTFWGDDVAYQFAMNNVFSITIPKIKLIQNDAIKADFGIPSSTQRKNTIYHPYNEQHHKLWATKWGFNQDWHPGARDGFLKIRNRYAGTILDKMVDLKLDDGPKYIEYFLNLP